MNVDSNSQYNKMNRNEGQHSLATSNLYVIFWKQITEIKTCFQFEVTDHVDIKKTNDLGDPTKLQGIHG
jgi:hypothetical protein